MIPTGTTSGIRPLSTSRLRRYGWYVVAGTTAWAFVRVLVPYLDVLALDLHALLENERVAAQSATVPVPSWVLDWAEPALRLLGMPLALTVTVGLLCRIRARLLAGSWRLSDAPTGFRVVLALIVFLLAVPAFAALGASLSAWQMLEAAWWMRAGLVADLWDRHPVAIPGAIHAAGALIAALITLGFVLRRPVPRRPGRFSRLARAGQRVLLVLVAGPVLALNVLLAVPLLAHAARVWPVRHGVAQFRERCSTCHAPGAPLYFVDTDEELSARLSVVDIAAKAKLTAGEEESIRSFVQGMRGFPAAWTFRSRCQRCHVLSSWTWDGRHRDDWRMIVDRVAAATPAYFSDSVRDQLTRYLSETRGDPDGLPGMDPGAYSLAVQTIGACSECHRFGRAADAHEDQTLEEAREVVRRMSGYRVAPFSDAEIDTMAAAYREILSDREAREHLVPHETPVLWERWLGW